MKKIIILFILLCVSYVSTKAQVFSKFYDYKGINDLGTDVICVKGGYLVISASVNRFKVDTLSYAQTFQQVIKYNKQGSIDTLSILRKPGYFLDAHGTSLLELNDTTYLNIGSIRDLVKYNYDSTNATIHIVKYNKNLDTLLTKTLHITKGVNIPVCVQKGENKSILIFGQQCTEGLPIKDCDYLFVKLDSNLNVLWQKSYAYDPIYWENPTAFVATRDKGFLLFGYTSAFIFEQKRYWYLVKTDSVGNKQWQKIFFKNNIQIGRGIVPTMDGNYLLTGSVETIITGGVKEFQGWLMKIDPNGNTIWEKIYGSDRFDYFRQAIENPDSSIIVTGSQTSERLTVNDSDAWLLKFDKHGNKLWERIYNNYSALRHEHPDDLAYSMRLTEDEGVIMVGFSNDPQLQNATQDIWLLKVDKYGCLIPGCQGVGIEGKRMSTEEVLIYPNPADKLVKLSHREIIKYYRLIDVNGKEVQSGAYTEQGIHFSPKIIPGTYLLHVEFEAGTQGFGKLIKE